MADEPQTPETDEVLDLTPEDQVTPPADEVATEEQEEEVLVFGDTPEEQAETESTTIRHLREELKKARKEAAEAKKPKAEVVDPGPRPTLEEHDYDEDKYNAALDAWHEERLAVKSKQIQSSDAQAAQVEATRQEIEQEKAALARPDVEEAFATVTDLLTLEQQSLLVHSLDAGNRAKVIYALAKNTDRLTALAAISDNPVKFIKEVAKLEGQLKMVKRKIAPALDTPARGSGPVSIDPTAAQKQLAKAKEEAGKTGDYTAYFNLKRKLGK